MARLQRTHLACLGLGVLCALSIVSGCDSLNPRVLGPRSDSGVLRVGPHSFGLLVFPCTTQLIDRVEVGVLDAATQDFTPLLRDTFTIPVPPSEIVVMTDPGRTSVGARREVLDASALDKFNNDEGYLTTPWPPVPDQFLVVRAFAPGGSIDLSGGASIPLNQRFDIPLGRVNVSGHVANQAEFACSGSSAPAWQAAPHA